MRGPFGEIDIPFGEIDIPCSIQTDHIPEKPDQREPDRISRRVFYYYYLYYFIFILFFIFCEEDRHIALIT